MNTVGTTANYEDAWNATAIEGGACSKAHVTGLSETHAFAAPEIPTLAEQDLSNYECDGWFAFVGPARMPAAEVSGIDAALVAAFAAPEIQKAMTKQGNSINPGTPEQAVRYFRSEIERMGKIVQRAGVKIE